MNDVMAAPQPRVARAEDCQQIQWLGQTRLRILLDGPATGGQLSVIEESFGAGDTSPMHVHYHEDEMFWLLEGSMLAWVGDQRLEVPPGGIALLPRGLPHAYRFTAPSRTLLLATPAGIEDMFRGAGWDLSRPVPEGWSVDMQLLKEITDRRGTPIVGPPPAG